MKKLIMKFVCFLSVFLSIFTADFLSAKEMKEFFLENAFLYRTLTVEDGILRTSEIRNKRTGKNWKIEKCPEFRLRLSEGTEFSEGDLWLASPDFRCTEQEAYELPNHAGQGFVFTLENSSEKLMVRVRYKLRTNEFYMKKRLEIRNGSEKARTLECVEVETIPAPDAFQPYTCREITAQAPAHWKPGLGQPLYTQETATFWGVEFPVASNTVEKSGKMTDENTDADTDENTDAGENTNGNENRNENTSASGMKTLHCAYLWGKKVQPGETYVSYPAVFGVGDDPEFIGDAFQDYINAVRVRPIRLQVQYNSWFDVGGSVSREKFAESVRTTHRELVEKRGCPPLNAYVIDDGWQRNSDILAAAWPVNEKFDPDFASTRKTVTEAGSSLGLWLSPGCFFGSRAMVKEYRDAGYEALSLSMSMCGPKYMDALQKRMAELTRQGITYFKLDGIFGHLNVRDYELHGRGCPAMPQLETERFSANDKRLNDSKYDELKTYYLVAGTERLISIFEEMHRINPNVYIVISNGAWLSPWWLLHTDTVWMINAGDAAGGSSRTEELVYRDGVYYNIWKAENTQFPMVSLFNHEPKKTSTGEPEEVFRKYLFMHLSRGTSFLELYIKPHILSDSDWNVLAEGVKWAHEMYPAFQKARMHGRNPRKYETYGYSGWEKDLRGYLSVHHPGTEKTTYRVTLDRHLGMQPGDTVYRVTTRVGTSEKSTSGVPETCRFGDTLALTLEPGEIRVLQFEALK